MKASTKRKLSFTNDHTATEPHHNSKKAHFNTPLKKVSHRDLVSTPFTPGSTSDNLFQTIPKHFDEDYSLLSSPPPIASSAIKKDGNNVQTLINNTLLKLSLSIGEDGRASISKSQSSVSSVNHTSLLETPTKRTKVREDHIEDSNNDKHEILSLLRKMRNGTSSVESSAKKPSNNIYPSSPPTVLVPHTPRFITSNSLIRTGLTPSLKEMDEHMVSLDQILLNTDKNSPVQEQERQRYIANKSILISAETTVPLAAHSEQFPFKSSVGDPLLINDDEQWTQIMNKSQKNPNSSEIRKLNDCSKKVTIFDTPLLKEPSTPRKRHLNSLVIDVSNSASIQGDINNNDRLYNRDIDNLITTPCQRKSSLQFTPLIQQTMTGSLGNKISPKILFSPRKVSNPSIAASINLNTSLNDDEVEASTVLKRLITGFN